MKFRRKLSTLRHFIDCFSPGSCWQWLTRHLQVSIWATRRSGSPVSACCVYPETRGGSKLAPSWRCSRRRVIICIILESSRSCKSSLYTSSNQVGEVYRHHVGDAGFETQTSGLAPGRVLLEDAAGASAIRFLFLLAPSTISSCCRSTLFSVRCCCCCSSHFFNITSSAGFSSE